MNNVMKDTSHLTPIEIALGIDDEGRTTATKLYDFLELNPGNYARWCKKNILENAFAEEGKDYYSSIKKSEGKGNFSEDYKLTASFAKKLSMMQKNSEKGEAARNYFIGVENGAKKLVEQKASYHIDAAVLKGLASTGNLIRSAMKDEKAEPHEVATVLDSLFKQGGLELPECFIKKSVSWQAEMKDFMKQDFEGR